MIVTIDGPAGAGKSTAARELACRLGFQFLDTGAMYRAVTLAALRRGIDLRDEPAVDAVARAIEIDLQHDRVFLDGDDVTTAIRTTDVTHESRHVAANLAVRAQLVELQRRLASGRNVVTEGRDQGTIAFPRAECKFYLTADPQQRAVRRQRELAARGETVPLEEILHQQTSRDERDLQRPVGRLEPAPDAILIDTSVLNPREMVDILERHVRARAEF